MSEINWDGMGALFERHPLPWQTLGKLRIIDGNEVTVCWTLPDDGSAPIEECLLLLINAAARPVPPFEPGLYPIKLNRGGDVKCPANEPWVTFFHDKMAFDGFRLANPAAIIGKRIEPEFPK